MKSAYTFNLVVYSYFVLGTVILCDRKIEKRQTESICSHETEYSCKSGQCIDITSTCDGVQDCSDQSDETITLCGSVECPNYAFKCKYGACINVEGRCDGENQCWDGSDEEQCPDSSSITTESITEESTTTESETTESTTSESTTSEPTTSEPTTSEPTTSESTTTAASPGSRIKPTESMNHSEHENKTCVIPTIEGTNHFYKDLNQNFSLASGTVVDPYRIVEEDCKEGYYKTHPYRFMVCSESGQWMPFVSDTLCLKKCPPMVSDILDIKCSLNGNNVNCSKPSEPGTKLTQSCKVANAQNLPRGPEATSVPNELVCLQNAKWTGQLLTTCTSRKELITNRVKDSPGIAPWNVEIYKINNDGNFNRICGGTLIAPNLVITAAHCFWKKGLRRSTIFNENNSFKIAVGKYNNDLSVMDHTYTQIIDIKLIVLKESYDGPSGMYADDISAVVLASNVTISDGVWPASIDWSTTYSPSNGDLGKMFGLGITNMAGVGQEKSILKLYTLPYIDRKTCQEMYTNGFQNYVTKDKFCTGYKLVAGEKYLKGFGGSGLIYERGPFAYLTGVLSIKDLSSNKSVAVFTSVQHHFQWICDIYKNYTCTA